MARLALRGAILIVLAMSAADAAHAQSLGALISPGPLSRPHASLEGVGSCTKCHDSGRAATAERCLACHTPIARRIANKTGVHRAVSECGSCHAEHRGADADLRPIDVNTFDHAVDAGFPLDGGHAAVAYKCGACHKTRSFLAARAACSTCHADVHKAQLGADCIRCHSAHTPFKAARRTFDHDRTQYVLTGAHRTVDCGKCHAGGRFRELRHEECSSCHRPHRRALGPSCASCHNTGTWTARLTDHTPTGFRLEGAHKPLTCAKCHPSGVTARLRADRCGSCHADVHRQSVKDDCGACHDARSFRGATFDHRTKTSFALIGRHDGLQCRKCHTRFATVGLPLAQQIVDFGGLKNECVTCHEDKHKGEFGRACEACHRQVKFSVTGFAHTTRAAEFFADRHAAVTCVKCHVRPPGGTRARSSSGNVGTAIPSMECRTCHTDVHLGQVGNSCERCHGIDAPKFAASRFSHDRAAFSLTGKHQVVACGRCHAIETRRFPSGEGTAMRLTQLPSGCSSCHKDPHLGQIQSQCDTCHTAASFSIFSYRHTGLSTIFNGLHGMVRCQACHKRETGAFPGGRGTTVRFKVPTACVACHPRY